MPSRQTAPAAVWDEPTLFLTWEQKETLRSRKCVIALRFHKRLSMILQGVWSEGLDFLSQKSLVVENSAGRLSSDAGLSVRREFDQKLRFTESFAALLGDGPPADLRHSRRL